MKTFETEKHNIPKGATHYFDEDHFNYFTWLMVDNDGRYWGAIEKEEIPKNSKPIPQTKEVEWENGLPPVGVGCEWIGGGVNHGDWGLVIVHAYSGDYAWIEKLHDNSMHTVKHPAHFRKPESPEEKKEREELEELSSLACESLFGESIQNCRQDVAATVRCMIEGGYRNDKVDNKKSTLY